MKKFSLLVLVFIVGLIVSACSGDTADKNTDKAQGSAEEAIPEEVTIGYQVIPNAELLAKELGLVEEKFPDTKINWVQFDSGRDVNTAMASGAIDLGLAGTVPVVTGVANDLPYQVYYIHDVIGEAESLVVHAEANIQSFEDLKGKRLAVPFGSTTHFSLLKALDLNGLKQGDVQVLDMQPQDILAAWQRGDIDGAFIWHPTLGKIQETGGQILITAEDLANEGIITADLGIVNKEFAEQYPQFIADYKSVLDEAVAQYEADANAVAQKLTTVLGVSEEEVLAQMEGLIWVDSTDQQTADYFGTADQKGAFAQVLQTTGEFLVDQAIIPSNPEASVFEESIYYGN